MKVFKITPIIRLCASYYEKDLLGVPAICITKLVFFFVFKAV